jgi:hypothetical protein
MKLSFLNIFISEPHVLGVGLGLGGALYPVITGSQAGRSREERPNQVPPYRYLTARSDSICVGSKEHHRAGMKTFASRKTLAKKKIAPCHCSVDRG